MKDHKIILDMIEKVSLDDIETLDEIDARVDALVSGHNFVRMATPDDLYSIDESVWISDKPMGAGICAAFSAEKYTRSRDALKAIRPNGWGLSIWNIGQYGDSFGCRLLSPIFWTNEVYDGLPTEELAELHAIISAIAYERSQNG